MDTIETTKIRILHIFNQSQKTLRDVQIVSNCHLVASIFSSSANLLDLFCAI